jgi:hypothetical protein
MPKIKLLAALVTALALLATPATPAGAWFKSRDQTKTTGMVKLGKTTFETPNIKVSCESVGGEWSIQTKGQFKDHEKSGKQVKTTVGPNLYVKLQKWDTCLSKLSILQDIPTIENCTFQLQQEQKDTRRAEALVSVVTACTFADHVGFKCIMHMTPGEEQPQTNAFLKQIKGENSGQEVIATANVGEIHATSTCAEMNITSGKFRTDGEGWIEEGLELA